MDQSTTQQPDLAIIVGEASGDLHASEVLHYLLRKNPHLRICAVSGPKMRCFSIDSFYQMEKLQVMGFIDVILSFPKLLFSFYRIRNRLLQLNPKKILFVDYPGMNLRLAQSLKRKGYSGKIFHYICPTVWAWGKKRIPQMEQALDALYTILPFEPEYFHSDQLHVSYVGNPLTQNIYPLPKHHDLTLGIFPGSRKKELLRNLPLFLKVAKKLKESFPSLKIKISCSKKIFYPLIEKMRNSTVFEISTTPLFSCDLAFATSGTITLELALQKIPTIVGYAIHFFDYFLATKIFKIRLPFYSLPNLIANEEIFLECYGPNFHEHRIYTFAKKILANSQEREKIQMQCETLKKILGKQNASARVAQSLLEANP